MNKKTILKKACMGKGGPVDTIKNIGKNIGGNARGLYQQIKYKLDKDQSDADFKALRLAKSYDKAPNYNNDGGVSDAFKARSVAQDVKDRLIAKNKKINKK